jgi:hypothetical protein
MRTDSCATTPKVRFKHSHKTGLEIRYGYKTQLFMNVIRCGQTAGTDPITFEVTSAPNTHAAEIATRYCNTALALNYRFEHMGKLEDASRIGS